MKNHKLPADNSAIVLVIHCAISRFHLLFNEYFNILEVILLPWFLNTHGFIFHDESIQLKYCFSILLFNSLDQGIKYIT